MKGFLKRDAYLLLPNLRIIAVFGIFIIGVAVASENGGGYMGFTLGLYLFIYSFAGVVGLFGYDTANHWQAYAAAVPGGRRDMVTARYLLTLIAVTMAAAICLGLGLVTRNEIGTVLAVLYSGLVLCYAAVVLPVSYRFDGDKSRLVMLVAVGIGAGVMVITGMNYMDGTESGLPIPWQGLPRRLALFPVAGLAALAVSWVISRHIMARKEL